MLTRTCMHAHTCTHARTHTHTHIHWHSVRALQWCMLRSAYLSARPRPTISAAAPLAMQLLPQLARHASASPPGSTGHGRFARHVQQLLQQGACEPAAAATSAHLQVLRVIAQAQGGPQPSARWAESSQAPTCHAASAEGSSQGRSMQGGGSARGSETAGGKAGKKSGGAGNGQGQALRPAAAAGGSAADAAATVAAREAARLKGDANQLFRAAQPHAAVQLYARALAMLAPRTATLLSNRAACFLCLGQQQQAALAACAARLLDPGAVKAAYRCASALLAMEWLVEAGGVAEARLHTQRTSRGGGRREMVAAAAAAEVVMVMVVVVVVVVVVHIGGRSVWA